MSHVVESQEPVFALLADPATYGGLPVKRIDTHAASVFLVGDRALKVKRAVRFPFLDFSDADKRRSGVPGRARGEPALCAGHLSPRGPYHARGRRPACDRWQRHADRLGGRDAPLR